MSLLPEDFFRLLPIRRKSGVRIRIQKKQGLPFFYRRSLKRKAFFIGIFLCLAGLYILSQFIWNIHVEGNYANSTQTILNSWMRPGFIMESGKNEWTAARPHRICGSSFLI